ncbi:MAG: restriction endonuclease subunit S [Caldilineaceae bacterium]
MTNGNQDWQEFRFTDVLEFRQGNVNPSRHQSETFELYSMPAYDVDQKPERVTGDQIGSSKRQVYDGDVLFARLNPRIPRVWAVTDTGNSYRKLTSTDFYVLVDKRKPDGTPWFDSAFLRYQLLSPLYRSQVIDSVQGATNSRQRLRTELVESSVLKVPSLAEQRRIVARIEALFAELRGCQQTLGHLQTQTGRLMEAFIREVFDRNSERWLTEPLDDIAYVQSGTAKGRRFRNRRTIELPYLRVANVQAGYLDLEEIKTIEIAEDEIDRYRLQVGDLLLTEGGDFDKLGRGSVWQGQIDPCIHQNHVFAVRFNPDKVIPEFAEYEMQSKHAKTYFMSVAKRTTNLASINKTQLRAFPFKYPSQNEQENIVNQLHQIKREVEKTQAIQDADARNFADMEQAILNQAFRGEL